MQDKRTKLSHAAMLKALTALERRTAISHTHDILILGAGQVLEITKYN